MIAILADIHGNLPALEAVLSDMPPVSEICVLGDIVGELPDPCGVLDLLVETGRRVPLHAIAGNREVSLLEARAGMHPDWWQGTQMRALAWTADQLRPNHWEWLAALPPTLACLHGKALLFHGSPQAVRGQVYTAEAAQSACAGLPYRWYFGGHTHHARQHRWADRVWINAGSVGISTDRITAVACYALVDEEAPALPVVFRYVGYPLHRVTEAMDACGLTALAPGITRAVTLEMQTGRLHVMSLIGFAQAYAAARGADTRGGIPADLWAEAETIWPGDPWHCDDDA